MARILAIVPVKPLAEGKSRLRSVLPDRDRLALNARFFERTLDVVAEFPGPALTIVVSRSPEVLAEAAARGMVPLAEAASSDLSAALAQATQVALNEGADGVFVLPVDLPLVTAASVRAAVTATRSGSLLLAPDHQGRGTNFLLQRPVLLRRYRFGPDSFERHRAEGEALGLSVTICRDAAFAFDVDRPEDLSLLQDTDACLT